MANKLVCYLTILSSLIALVYTAPPPPSSVPTAQPRFQVVSDTFHQDENLEYNFEQKFANGETFSEDGKLRQVNGMDVIVTKGSYTLKNADGSETIVNYTADETGFHPEIITPADRH